MGNSNGSFIIDSVIADMWVRMPDPTHPGGWVSVHPRITTVVDTSTREIVACNVSVDDDPS